MFSLCSALIQPFCMSDTEQDTSVLGKRSRNGQEVEVGQAEDAERHDPNAMDAEDDDDEDVGPMPMPAEQEGHLAKKKRKGVYDLSAFRARRVEGAPQSCRMRSSTSSTSQVRTDTTKVSCTGM